MGEFVLQLSRSELLQYWGASEFGTLQVHVGEGRIFHQHSHTMGSGPVLEC